ncbi:MAG: 4-(cytidine 5'-diphospho)-2-C-methyl-D-erythritol kinase [Shimia sp.]
MAEAPPARAFAAAKVNLTLHVVGKRPDGYHLLDSLVAFADIGDRLTARPARVASLSVTGRFAEGVPLDAGNLAWRAAQMIAPDRPVRMTLEKHLPHAAGIGGGSADAAAVLRMLSRLFDLPIPEDAAQLGADVPLCLARGARRMAGVGEVLTPVELPPLPAVLANPGVPVPTAEVFARVEAADGAPMPDLPLFEGVTDAAAWISAQRNDLQVPARAVAPVIDDVIDRLEAAPGCLLARMTGSGGTCYGLFPDRATAAAAAAHVADKHPDWWVVDTVLA